MVQKDQRENWKYPKESSQKKKSFLQQEGIDVPKEKPGRKKNLKPSTVTPTIPDEETEGSLQQLKAKLLSESKKNHPNPSTLKNLMENNFPLRRKEGSYNHKPTRVAVTKGLSSSGWRQGQWTTCKQLIIEKTSRVEG